MKSTLMPRRLIGPALGFLWSLAIAVGPAHGEEAITEDGAVSFIEALATETLAVLTEPEATEESKEARVKVLVARGFDLPQISKFVLGRFWRSATEEQLSEYHELFERSVVGSYTHALVASGGTGFEILSSQRLSATDVLVNSRLERSEGPPIGAGWRVRLVGGTPKIIDVVHEGVSLALPQRQEYASVIERQGIEGLLAILRRRS